MPSVTQEMANSGASINTKRKVVLAFLLGLGAIVVALVVSYFGFNKILTVVDELSVPNQKLTTLHNLFQRVAELEHRQRLEAIENPRKTDQAFLQESNSILLIVDSLTKMHWADTLQLHRLQEIQRILHTRDSLFVRYLQVKSNALRNKRLSKKFDTLARILSNNVILTDTSVRTTQKKKTVVSYSNDSSVKPPVQKRSFLSRLFKKKQPATVIQKPKEKITEEVVVIVDTLAMAQRSNSVTEATKLIQELGVAELSRRKRLANRELTLLKTTTILFSQMTDIVHRVQEEEILSVRKSNEAATRLFIGSIRKMLWVLIVFCLMTATMVYFILIDITRSNYYKAQLTDEKDKAEELSKAKQRFLDNMSHEIRTPLQSIIGFAEQLLKKITAETKSEIQAIHSSSEHLLHVVNEVLYYSRLDSGKMVFENRKFYFSEVVEEVALAMRVQAETKGLQFYFDDKDSENYFVEGDSFRLKQVLYNLVGNAIKFTEKGCVTLAFEAKANDKNVSVHLQIIDTGIGIDENEIDKIFQRFEQANPSISSIYGGSGLGLTIVKRLVEAQNGTLKINSSPGNGSTFLVDLVFAGAVQDTLSETQTQHAHLSRAHVLVVDDDPSILQLCNMILTDARIRCSLQNEPIKLFEDAFDDTITHILMDVRMGKVDGLELAKALRKRIRTDVPVIAMSAMVQLTQELEFKEVFDALLLKPFRADELKNILSRFSAEKANTTRSEHFSEVGQLTLGNSELLRSALSNFVHETEIDMVYLDKAIKSGDVAGVKDVLHKMKGRIAQFGYLSVSTSMNYLEDLLEHNHSVNHYQNEMAQLKASVSDIILKARNELVNLN